MKEMIKKKGIYPYILSFLLNSQFCQLKTRDSYFIFLIVVDWFILRKKENEMHRQYVK
jgi:hypothetical protein